MRGRPLSCVSVWWDVSLGASGVLDSNDCVSVVPSGAEGFVLDEDVNDVCGLIEDDLLGCVDAVALVMRNLVEVDYEGSAWVGAHYRESDFAAD